MGNAQKGVKTNVNCTKNNVIDITQKIMYYIRRKNKHSKTNQERSGEDVGLQN